MELGDNQRETGLKVPGLSVPDVHMSGCDSDGLIHMEEINTFISDVIHSYYLIERSTGKSNLGVKMKPLTWSASNVTCARAILKCER